VTFGVELPYRISQNAYNFNIGAPAFLAINNLNVDTYVVPHRLDPVKQLTTGWTAGVPLTVLADILLFSTSTFP
jgi:hypothetical protein